jgi:carbamate kinase
MRFVTASGQPAAIGALTDAADILAGRAGTTISAARRQANPSRSPGGSGQ